MSQGEAASRRAQSSTAAATAASPGANTLSAHRLPAQLPIGPRRCPSRFSYPTPHLRDGVVRRDHRCAAMDGRCTTQDAAAPATASPRADSSDEMTIGGKGALRGRTVGRSRHTDIRVPQAICLHASRLAFFHEVARPFRTFVRRGVALLIDARARHPVHSVQRRMPHAKGQGTLRQLRKVVGADWSTSLSYHASSCARDECACTRCMNGYECPRHLHRGLRSTVPRSTDGAQRQERPKAADVIEPVISMVSMPPLRSAAPPKSVVQAGRHREALRIRTLRRLRQRAMRDQFN